MHFVHDPYSPGATIAAIATPPGEGGVAIIRICGSEALTVGDRLFSGKVPTFESHSAHYGRFLDEQGKTVDSGLVLVMRGSRSYAGEDTVELHCHGGALVTRRLLELSFRAGARAARPGEFTFRAFINGKLDLAQAEAVQDLIAAQNEAAVDAATAQLQGRLSEQVHRFQDALTDSAGILEAWVDFPEEGLEFASQDELLGQLEEVRANIASLIDSFHDGRIVSDGLSIALIGTPNVGKSSLMNALLDKERAIVTHIAGTTRDILEDHMRLNGLHIKLLDTAGVREAEDVVEREGVRRSLEAMQAADLVLMVMDATRGLEAEDRALLQRVPKAKTVYIWNKVDAASVPLELDVDGPLIEVSAKEGRGLDGLRAAIDAVIWRDGPPAKDQIVLTSARHKEALQNAEEALGRVISGLYGGVSPEFVTMDMRACLTALGKVIGTDITESILSSIFSRFCIGK